MSQPKTFNIGGVPEHFNLPWTLAIQDGAFEQEGLTLHWKDYPGGTGALTKDLRNGTLDVAVLLTEGILADICKGNPSKIISPYVVSPLVWGIHVPAGSSFQSVDELQGKRFAISRYGSGSHLMAFVLAQQYGWNPNDLELVLIGDINGARESFKKGESDAFMWEKAMTQPLVDNGEFRRVGECPTPWPSFVVAARQEVIEQEPEALRRMLSVITQTCQIYKNSPDTIPLVADRYGIRTEDVAAWLTRTEWTKGSDNELSDAILQQIMQTLLELNVIEERVPPTKLYYKL